MFQQIDFVDQWMSPGCFFVLFLILILAGVCGTVVLTVRKGITKSIWMIFLLLVLTGLFVLRYGEVSVHLSSNIQNSEYPAIYTYKKEGLPLIPENELGTFQLKQLGEILDHAVYQRYLFPTSSSGADFRRIEHSVDLRGDWADAKSRSEILIGYQLRLYARYPSETKTAYEELDAKGDLILEYADSSKVRSPFASSSS